MRHNRSSALVIVAALLAGACAEPGDDATAPLPTTSGDSGGAASIEGSWRVVSGETGGDAVGLFARRAITLEFTRGPDGLRLTGVAGCNGIGGAATASADGSFSIASLAVDEAGCEPVAVMQLEQRFVTSLVRLDTWSIDDDGTLVLAGGADRWTFESVGPVPPAALVGTPWFLDALLMGDTASSVASDGTTTGEPALTLSPDGNLAGSSGCHVLEGRWSGAEPEIVISELDVIDDPGGGVCSGSAVELDRFVRAVLDVRGGRLTATITDDRLTLLGADRDGLTYVAGDIGERSPRGGGAPGTTTSQVSVRPVLACGEAVLAVEADAIEVDPAQQLDCALGPPIADTPVFANGAEAISSESGAWSVRAEPAVAALDAWDAATATCFERGARCPLGQLAIVANGAIASVLDVSSAVPADEIVITGTFTEPDAEAIATAINASR